MSRFRINPGEFRHVITFQKLQGTQNDYGEEIKDPIEWEEILTVRAGIYPMSGREFFAAETVNSEVTHKINMRYVPGITSDMRIKYGERTFELSSPPINFQEKNILLQLLCKELI
ncbi:phage head closure protein [Lederbergia wuyishanensis]|uniref:SPP1 family predicted phage head-tail adaptor n=1 Tax=Lederbergia wuyishanensis TaxID=1347903 RepID=A0ABU0D4G5_9BACI|nr:phage head closure protein [Lederbergia wuyishanensis]MCJ8008116.1 phage head closure protein [Lederbergia wuyishanensis]MDQ0343298.1 SPP1 family predicted phage head-tail adaptor [Lederbergia wuyishanensis]